MRNPLAKVPGWPWAVILAVLLAGAYALNLAETRTAPGIVAMRERGLVTQAAVTGKREVKHERTSSRDSPYTAYVLEIAFDPTSGTSWKHYIANGEKLAAPAAAGLDGKASLNVLRPEYDAAKPGDKIVMVIDPARPGEPMRVEEVSTFEVGRYRNIAVFLIALAVVPLGLWLRAWRKARA